MSKIGFIGMGNMGRSILNSLMDIYPKEDLMFSCLHPERGRYISEKTGVRFMPSNIDVAREADIIFLGIRKKDFDEVLDEINYEVVGRKIVITMAPAVSIAYVSKQLGGFARVVRALPNSPARVRTGMTGLAYDRYQFSGEDVAELRKIFDSFGRTILVDENLIDTLTVVNATGSAFVYMFIDALANSGVRYGLSKQEAMEMVAQTVMGCAKMVLETGEHPIVLSDQICIPSGTTIEAIAALDEAGFRNAVMKGAEACYRKTQDGADAKYQLKKKK